MAPWSTRCSRIAGDGLPGIGGERRPGIVHRLDKDTSGVMVVAKTEAALAGLAAAFAARDLDRAYLALCWGVPAPAAGEIEGAIGRDPRDRKRMAVVARGGKRGADPLPPLRQPGARRRACWNAGWRPGGRTRSGCISRRAATRWWATRSICGASPPPPAPCRRPRAPAALDFPRQALHAARLGFRHPVTGAALGFETPPPADMAALIASLDAAAVRI